MNQSEIKGKIDDALSKAFEDMDKYILKTEIKKIERERRFSKRDEREPQGHDRGAKGPGS